MTISERALGLFQTAGAVALSDGIGSIGKFSALPIDQLTFPDESSFLDEVGIVGFSTTEHAASTTFHVDLLLATEVVFALPGLDGVSLVIGTGAGAGVLLGLEQELGPSVFEFRATTQAVLRISQDLLRPVKKVLGKWEELPGKSCEIAFSATVGVDGDRDVTIVGPGEFSLAPAMIGKTGIVIEADKVTPIFSSKAALPPDRPPEIVPGWRGVFIERAAISFPESWKLPIGEVEFLNCYIGNGGFTGEVQKAWSTPMAGELAGLPFTLSRIHIAFRQNALVSAALSGTIDLPFFGQEVSVDVSFDLAGKLSVALSAKQPVGVTAKSGRLTFTKPGLLEMSIDSLRFELDGGVFAARLAGSIKPLVGGLNWPTFDVQELSINSKGEASVAGGWIDLPQGYTLNLHAFKLEITKFGIGRDANGDQYIGFNGALDLVKGIPAGASVEGLRITWGKNKAPSLSFQGVGVELTIPNKLHFKGEVSYEVSGDLHAFTGRIALELPAVNGLTIDGRIVFGSTLDPVSGKRFKYFALYLDGEFGTGIPLWATGLALNGVAGLFSVNYAPKKSADMSWWSMDKSKSWYDNPPVGVTDIVKKWGPESGTFALGAGVSIGTYADGGRLFNGKFLLLMLFPGGVFMIDGRGSFLEKPSADKEPQFHALVVLDPKAGYFLIGLDAKWKNDKETGNLVEIAGSAETYFNFNDPRDWHIAIGKPDQRIQASFAGGLQANAYFMLDPRSLKVGVWLGKNDHYKVGPVQADLEAWLDSNATLSFGPPHLNAAVWIHGLLRIKVSKWRFAIGLDAHLEADVAKPFHILGSVAISIETRLKTFTFEVRIEYGPLLQRPTDIPDAFRGSGIAHLKSTTEWPLLADGNGRGPVVPLDARPYLTFEQPVHDATGISVNPSPDPGWITVGDPTVANREVARVRYVLKSIVLQRSKPGEAWEVYPHRLYGSWAALPPAGPNSGGTQNRFMVYAKTPFDLTSHTESWNPWVGTNLPSYPCPIVASERACVDLGRSIPTTPARTVASPWGDRRHQDFRVEWTGGVRDVVRVPEVQGHDQGILFSAPQGAQNWTVYVPLDSANGIARIDTSTDAVIGTTIPVGKSPVAIAFSRDGKLALVSNADDASVSLVDTGANTVIGKPIAVAAGPWDIAFSRDGTKAYVTSSAAPILSVIDVPSRALKKQIALLAPSEGIVIHPDGSRVYVALAPAGGIPGGLAVIDTIADAVVGKPIFASGGLQRIAISPDGARVYAPGFAENRVLLFDTKSNAFASFSIPVGREPRDVTVAPDGSRVYVVNSGDNTVSVIDAAQNAVIATLPVGGDPRDVTVTPDGARIYVGNRRTNSVTVIQATTLKVLGGEIAVGGKMQGIAVCPVPRVASTQSFDVFINVPPGSKTVDILLTQTKGRVIGDVVDPVSKVPSVWTDAVETELHFDATQLRLRNGFKRIRIRSDHDWTLIRVCSARPALDGGLADLTKLHDDLARGLEVWGAPGAVLEPFTDYRLSAEVERTINGVGALAGWTDVKPYNPSWRFRTEGPPGIRTPDSAPGSADIPKVATGLEDLTRYVSHTVPRTLALPGQRPELQRPVFRAYDVGCEFNEDYVDRMYELAGRDLSIRLFDSDDEPVRGVGGGLVVSANPWGKAAELTLTETNRRWLELLNAASCLKNENGLAAVDLKTIPLNKTLATSDLVLDACRLYEARLTPLLLRAPLPGGTGWTTENVAVGVDMLKHTGRAPIDPSEWTDILVEVMIRPLAAGPSGVAFRVGAIGRYVFAVDAQLGKRRLLGLAGSTRESSFPYDASKTYRISIEMIGTRVRIEQDGELVFDVNDASFSSGSIGLFPWLTSGSQHFSDLSVHDFRKGAPAAYAFKFTASMFADFFHQIHSYQDLTWRGRAEPSLDLGKLFGARAKDLASSAPEDEARAYDTLADALLGAAARQLPAALEVTRVDQGGAVPTLWVRGGEPIDWRRTTLDVSFAGSIPPARVEPGPAKLTDAIFGATPSDADIATVMLREGADLTGYRIEARVPAGPLVPATGPALLNDEFHEAKLTGWSLVDELPAVPVTRPSSWNVTNGELLLAGRIAVAPSSIVRGTMAFAGDVHWADVTISVRLRSADGGAMGLVFRAADLQNYYRFAMNAQQSYREVVKSVGGVLTVLWRDQVGYDPAKSHELTVIAVGPMVHGFVNGVPMFAVEDSAISAGRIALYSGGSTYFSEVRVDPSTRVATAALVDEHFRDVALDHWRFDEAGELAPAWEQRDGEMLAPVNHATALGELNGPVHALAVAGASLFAAGAFTMAGVQGACGVAQWDGLKWSPFGTGFDGPVFALAVTESEVYAGGQFSRADGHPAANVAVWNRGAGTWSTLGSGVNGSVRALAVQTGTILVGGQFTSVGGKAANNVARFAPGSGQWSALGGGLNGRVNALAVTDRGVFAGGSFVLIRGAPASGVAIWSDASWSSPGTGPNGEVFALTMNGVELWAGGNFAQAGGTPAKCVARWMGRSWSPVGGGLSGPVRSLTAVGGDIYAGGDFVVAGGEPTGPLARWQTSLGAWSLVSGVASGPVSALASTSEALYTSSEFSRVGELVTSRVAKVELRMFRAALVGDPAWDDYRLVARFRPGTQGSTELVFRHQAPDRFYALRHDTENGRVLLIRNIGDQESVLWKASSPLPTGSDVLVTIDCVGDHLAGYWNAQPLFKVVDAELPNGRVGLRVRGETGARVRELRLMQPVWTHWYAFGKDVKRAAGTRFEVHGGIAGSTLPPQEPEVLRRFIPRDDSPPRWPAERVDLRLVGSDGDIKHSRSFLPLSAFVPVDVSVMRSADGTGFFLIPATETAFSVGTYRLALSYAREKSGVDPVLSRGGSRSMEKVAIDIPWSTTRG